MLLNPTHSTNIGIVGFRPLKRTIAGLLSKTITLVVGYTQVYHTSIGYLMAAVVLPCEEL